MAAKDDSADKTEKPTPKRLRDARKKGDVAKSKELTSTVAILAWLGLFWLFTPTIYRRLEALYAAVFTSLDKPFLDVVGDIGWMSFEVFLLLTIPLLLPIALLAVFTEFLQIGAIFAPTKLKPEIDRLNPAEGVKRMFSQENLVEVVKSLFKTAALAGIAWLVIKSQLNEHVRLPYGHPGAIGQAYWHDLVVLGGWVIFVFFFVSVMDSAYQKYAYIKNLRMSRRDIRREMRDDEGDPYIKQRRRQLHEEWSTRNVLESVRRSSVVVTNPTHVAVALLYEPGETVVPVVAAKGEEHMAKLIREAAEEAGVPIMQNVDLARGLYERAEVDEFIPIEFFEAVAELLRWADSIRQAQQGDLPPDMAVDTPPSQTPEGGNPEER
jgi:type III secretion protein U